MLAQLSVYPAVGLICFYFAVTGDFGNLSKIDSHPKNAPKVWDISRIFG